MSRSRLGSVVHAAVVVFALTVAPRAALATDNDANTTGTVDCGNQNTKDSCIECCTSITCAGKISCCPLSGDCSVVNKPGKTDFPPLSLKVSVGGLKLQIQRKGDDASGADLKMKASFLKGVFQKPVQIKAHLSGADARIGALLYPIAFVGLGAGAEAALQSHGYDVAVDATPYPTCQERFPAQACNDLATLLSKAIHGALLMSGRDDLDPFLTGVFLIGYPSCPVIF